MRDYEPKEGEENIKNAVKCPACEGTGKIVTHINPDGSDYSEWCETCNGTGILTR